MTEPPSPAWLDQYVTGHYRPVTFLDRGVALPFTTPALLGARIRPASRGAVELVLANPSGTEGVYVVPWGAIEDVATLTLHDRSLCARLRALTQLSPRTIRAVAREVAAEGFAGRAAARSAEDAALQEARRRETTEFRLLVSLIRQGEPVGSPPLDLRRAEMVQQRAGDLLRGIARTAGIPATAAYDGVVELAGLAAFCGLRGEDPPPMVPATMAELRAVLRDIAAWAPSAGGEAEGCLALLEDGAEMTLRAGQLALDSAQGILDDLPGLLISWQAKRDQVAVFFARPEWVLDGWDAICALWRAAHPAQRRAALMDMASLVPVMPAEVSEWAGFDASGGMEVTRNGLRGWRRRVGVHEDWITGRMLELIARNESARARCA